MTAPAEPTRVTVTFAQVTPATVWTFLEVVDGDGVAGLGECSLNGHEEALIAVAGRVLATPEAWRAGEGVRLPGAATALAEAAVLSGLGQAMADIAARRAGIPLSRHIGGAAAPAPVPLYANINRRTRDRSPEGFAASAGRAVADGFRAIKIAPFDEVSAKACRDGAGRRLCGPGLARIAAARSAIGPDCDLMVDCHWRLDAATAEWLVEAAAPSRLHWLECPLAETDANIRAIAALRSRANAAGVRLAGLEEGVSPDVFVRFAEAGAYDDMMPDIKYAGGYAGMIAVAAVLDRCGVAVSPHNPTGPVAHAASLAVAGVLAGFTRLEMQVDETARFHEIVAGGARPRIAAGAGEVAAGAGLGVTLDAAEIDRDTIATVTWEPGRGVAVMRRRASTARPLGVAE